MRRFATALAVTSAFVAGCSLPIPWERLPAPSHGPVQEGVASWYGPAFQGRRTASGEVYDQERLTAAHQTLPFGTRVRVTNLENGRHVVVRINDRGPFKKRRILDLSRAAAREIGMLGRGTARVRIESSRSDAGLPGPVRFAAQAGSFRDQRRAASLRNRLSAEFADVYVAPYTDPRGIFYRVRLGPVPTRREAEGRARALSRFGIAARVVEEEPL